MDVTKLLKQATGMGWAGLTKASEALGAGFGFIRQSLGATWLFASTETSSAYDEQLDEKHYFLVPYRLSEVGYSLYSMRCLPEGVPPINDLPKRRIFHLPSEHAKATVEHLLLEQAREAIPDADVDSTTLGNRLIGLADQIDQLDDKVFGGVLLIGGLVALVNPVAGAAVAAKALIPSFGMLLSKYGLKYAGESANDKKMEKQVRAAEKEVLRQFRGSDTSSLVSPLLGQLDHALNTTEFEYDPLLDGELNDAAFGEYDQQRFSQLTCRAVANVYEDVLKDKKKWQPAQLGPEDVRWLKLLRERAGH